MPPSPGCATIPDRAPTSSSAIVSLNNDWYFHQGPLPSATDPDSANAPWQPITLPHTWNNLDGQDGGDNYFKGDGWYRRTLAITPDMLANGQQLFLRFQGVNRTADVYLNGKFLGSHAGGNSAFCFNATAALHPGDNLLAVRASNARDNDTLAPLFKDGERGGADFTYFGGIYRPVELIVVNPLHMALTDYASPGVFITTPEITDSQAKIHVRTLVRNDGFNSEAPPFIDVVIRDAAGIPLVVARTPITAWRGQTQELSTGLQLPNPHRWNGRIDPYLYSVTVTIMTDRGLHPDVFDSVTQPLGIRTFSIDPQKGFFLNGKSYPLHGVSRHQDRRDKGWAISPEDETQDMALIKEMGANTIRLAHYQQSDFFYSLADKEGMIVWAEIPVVNYIGPSKAFTDNARDQYKELIRQNFNHPSILFWSTGNEVRKPRPTDPFVTPNDPDPTAWFKQMSDLAHAEDPGRLSAVACRRDTPYRTSTDVYGLNIYYGWYESSLDNIDHYFSTLPASPTSWALTEYGAGGSIYFHSEKPVKMDHSEEYQCILHEATWAAIKKHPEIWGSYIWNMFDFAVDDRFEGDHAGINDKGMVTYDRANKKDVFYFYQANWTDTPMVHLNSKRFTTRGQSQIAVKAYSNAPTLSLTVNGTPFGEKQNNNATFTWESVPLRQGSNTVIATAQFPGGKILTDTATWTYTPGAPTEVYDAQDATMREVYKAAPPRSNYPKNPYAPPTRPRTTAPASRPQQP